MDRIKIDVNKEVTGRLPFEPFEEFNDLCVGTLTDVEVYETEIGADKQWEYKGMTVPVLAFRFTQYKRNDNEKDRFMTMSFMPIANTKADGTNREQSALVTSFTQLFDKVRHLHDQYAGNDNFSKFTTEFDFDPNGSREDRIAAFKVLFESIVKDFNIGKDKATPVYNKNQYLAIVMVASGQNKSYLSVPDFVGKGIFDIFKAPSGKIDTYLKIPVNQTVKLGVNNGGATALPQPGAAMAGLPDDLQNLIANAPQ